MLYYSSHYVCGILTGLTCQSCPQQFGTPWSLMKHAQSVHALKIYLEAGPFSSSITEVSYYPQKQSASSKQSNIDGSFSIVENSKSDSETLSYTPQQSVDLNGFVLKNSLSSSLQVLPACNLDPATQDQFNNSELVQPSVCRNLSENFENMPPGVYAVQKKSLSIDNDKAEQISGDLASQSACTESCVEDVENVSGHSAVLEKCCSSVLPKKRKRHMEIKHGGSRKRPPVVSSGPTSIYIDLEPGSEGHSFRASLLHDTLQDPITFPESESARLPRPSVRRHSVIIQPGMTFSIPVSHDSMSLAPSFNYPIVADSVTTHDPSSYGQKSTYEQYLHGSNTVDHTPTVPDTLTYNPVQELIIDEQKNSVDESLHDELIGEEQGQGKMLEHKRRRYPTSRPFKCDQCDNAFNQRIHLKKHQSKHTGRLLLFLLSKLWYSIGSWHPK